MSITNDQILATLTRIEREHGVRVLLAVESGSRAWGFASRDSGHEVRFIYAHPHERDPAVDERHDVIQVSIADSLNLSGWDVRKALRLVQNSNPSLHEWIKSPIIHRAEPTFALLFGLLANEFYVPERSFRHYLRMAQSKHRDDLQGDRVPINKYLTALRPLLAAQWIERRLGAVPMKFSDLVDQLVDDVNMRFHIGALVARKRAGGELDEAQRIPPIDVFIERELARLEKIAPVAQPGADEEKLNQFFREFCLAEAA